MVKSDTKLIKLTLEHNDFKQTESNVYSVCWLGNINNQHNKYQFFENLQEYQKINHFPMSTEITRKDRLAVNMRKFQKQYDKHSHEIVGDLDVTPDTYILPDHMSDFREAFLQQQAKNASV